MDQEMQRAHDALTKAQRVLIVAHQRPDGDTTGSSLALWHWLDSLGIETLVFCKHPAAEQYLFLSHANHLVSDAKVFKQPWDVMVTCDAGDLRYAGVADYVSSMPKEPVIINFDHHVSNEYFGDFNLVDVRASSTAEVVSRFFEVNGVRVTKDMASCLLAAVFSDTGGFSNAATTQRSLELAANFLRAGASLPHVYRATMVNKNIAMMKIWGRVLGRLQNGPQGIVYTYVKKQDLDDYGVDGESVEGLSNYLSQLQDARAVLVFHDRGDGTIKASMRTVRDDIDLAAFAKHFGGGGHKKASGFTVAGRLEDENGRLRIVRG